MLITGAVDSVSNLPNMAIFGSSLIFFFLLAVALFLIPVGLISAELCKQIQGEGGVYTWIKHVFGEKVSIIAIWLQWINTMVWFPTCLTTLIATTAYLINPNLAKQPIYLVMMSLIIFWLMTFINLRGIQTSSRIASFATMFGMIIPIYLIIILCGVWLIKAKPLAINMSLQNMIPNLSAWNALTAIIAAFLGIELSTVHINKIKNGVNIFPKALIYSVILITLTLGLGALSVALVIPHNHIVLVTGTIQVFSYLFDNLNLAWLKYVLGLMLLLGSIGSIVNWLISPANGLLQAARDGYLPTIFLKENKHGVPSTILIAQAIVVSITTAVFFLMPTLNGSYWLLLSLSTELYVLMYILMFFSALILFLKVKQIYLIPLKKLGAAALSIIGLISCIVTFIIGFMPPKNINVGSSLHFTFIFTIGLFAMLFPIVLLYLYKNYNK